MKFFLDTYALIEIANGNVRYEKYLESDCVTLIENLAELFYFMLKKHNEKTAIFFFHKFSRIAVEFPLELVPKSMILRYDTKKNLSYTDCLGYCYSLENKRIFLTGDRAFTGMNNVEIVR